MLYFPQSPLPTGWQSLVSCPLSVPLRMENQGTRALLCMEHGAPHRGGGGPCWLNRGRLHCNHEARRPQLRQGRGAACAGPSSPGEAELRGSGQPAPSRKVPSPVCAAAVSSHGQWEHVCAVQGCYEDYRRYVQSRDVDLRRRAGHQIMAPRGSAAPEGSAGGTWQRTGSCPWRLSVSPPGVTAVASGTASF